MEGSHNNVFKMGFKGPSAGWLRRFRYKYRRQKSKVSQKMKCNCELQESGLAPCCSAEEASSVGGGSNFFEICRLKMNGSSVRSLRRYLTGRRGDSNNAHIVNKASNTKGSGDDRSPVESPAHEKMTKEAQDFRKILTCQHPTGFVLRGRHQHASPESCALYCQLSRHGWYWGGIATKEAEELLAGQVDGVFLVRDSFHVHHLLCISFRCVGRTLHARLRHANGLFSLNNETFVSVSKLSEHCTSVALNAVKGCDTVSFRLAAPLNRFAKLDSLQLLCRFVLRQSLCPADLLRLPLPPDLLKFVITGSDYSPP